MAASSLPRLQQWLLHSCGSVRLTISSHPFVPLFPKSTIQIHLVLLQFCSVRELVEFQQFSKLRISDFFPANQEIRQRVSVFCERFSSSS